MTTLLLVRHGETDWNRERRWQGHSDPPLNKTGREQARELAATLDGEPIDAVYASDLRRAAETAGILAARLGLPVVLEPGLREINAGSWEGLTADEILERHAEAFARWRSTGEPGWENGEGQDEMAERAELAVRAIAEAHPEGTVLVVAHGGPVKAVLMRAQGLDYVRERRETPPIANCQVCRLALRDGTFVGLD